MVSAAQAAAKRGAMGAAGRLLGDARRVNRVNVEMMAWEAHLLARSAAGPAAAASASNETAARFVAWREAGLISGPAAAAVLLHLSDQVSITTRTSLCITMGCTGYNTKRTSCTSRISC